MNDVDKKSSSSKVTNVRQMYADAYPVRALIQAVPYVGGSLDTLMSGRSAQIQLDRVETFTKDLSDRLSAIENTTADFGDEAFSDLMLNTFEAVTRTRSEKKRSRFAEIISNQVAKPTSWEEPENAVRLLSSLEDIHIEIISAALRIPISEGSFSGQRVISLLARPIDEGKANQPISLLNLFPSYGTAALRMSCAELLSKGLLHDAGIGRLGVGPMTYFAPTDLAEWFSTWISLPLQR